MSVASIQGTASKLCRKFGQSVTFNRYAKGTIAATGQVTGKTAPSATFMVDAVVLPVNNGMGPAFDNGLINGSLAGKKLRYIQVAAQFATFEPKALDEVVMTDGTWKVIGCTPIHPNGLNITYGVGMYLL